MAFCFFIRAILVHYIDMNSNSLGLGKHICQLLPLSSYEIRIRYNCISPNRKKTHYHYVKEISKETVVWTKVLRHLSKQELSPCGLDSQCLQLYNKEHSSRLPLPPSLAPLFSIFLRPLLKNV